MDELKPCPFCGKMPKLTTMFDNELFCVQHMCRSFNVILLIINTPLFSSKEDAINAWNRRASD